MPFSRFIHEIWHVRLKPQTQYGRKKSHVALLLILCSKLAYSQEIQTVIFPGTANDYYYSLLLEHALSYNKNKRYHVQPLGAHIPKDRNFELLASDDGLHVVFAGSTLEREQKHRAVHFPLLKGLQGWRIPLVRRNQLDLFKNVHNLEAFKKLIPGQYHTWSDTEILEANGITVAKGSDFEGLFGMLSKGRFDYFPRSILEIDQDYLNHKNLNIAIEPSVIIHYPTAFYFYVNKDNHNLAKVILDGLETALLDGSFNKLFMQYFGEQVEKVINTKRRIIELANPLLPATAPLGRSELWLKLN